jgi:hypothetical protein
MWRKYFHRSIQSNRKQIPHWTSTIPSMAAEEDPHVSVVQPSLGRFRWRSNALDGGSTTGEMAGDGGALSERPSPVSPR